MTKLPTSLLLTLGVFAAGAASAPAQMLANDWGTGIDGRTLDPVKDLFGWVPYYESPGEKRQAAIRAEEMAEAARREESRRSFAEARRQDRENSRRLNAPLQVGQDAFQTDAGPVTLDRAQTAYIAQQAIDHETQVAHELFGASYGAKHEVQEADWKPGYIHPAFEHRYDQGQQYYSFHDPRGLKQSPGRELQVTDADLNRLGLVDGQDYSTEQVTRFGRQFGQHLTELEAMQAPSDWPSLRSHWDSLGMTPFDQHLRLANDLHEWDERRAKRDPDQVPWPVVVSKHRGIAEGSPGYLPEVAPDFTDRLAQARDRGILNVPTSSPTMAPQPAPAPRQAAAPTSGLGAGLGGAVQADSMGD